MMSQLEHHSSTALRLSAPSCRSAASGCCIANMSKREGERLFRLACEHDLEGIVAK